jgi:branched-chain amino acid transport system ATP-binding protein
VTPLLKIATIETLYYDRIYALHGLSLEVKEKEIFTVLGPNGAGKTTLLKTIAGLLKDQPKKGTIEFMGKRIHRLAPERVARLGIVYVPEDRGLFRELTVQENLELGCWGRKDSQLQDDFDFIYELFPILKERAGQESETLSGGEQQMLAMARAMLRRPKLLMLDEPSLGLAPQVARQVYDALSKISQACQAGSGYCHLRLYHGIRQNRTRRNARRTSSKRGCAGALPGSRQGDHLSQGLATL